MKLNEVINKLNEVKNGTFQCFNYKTDLPVRAAYKKQGISITKLCNTTARFGIFYGNVVDLSDRGPYKKPENKEWIIKNKLEHNTDKDRYYVNVYTGPNKSKVQYILNNNGVSTHITKDEAKEYVIDSYFNGKSSTPSKIFKINIDNVISIGRGGDK